MSYSNVSASVAPADLTAVFTAIDTINSKLPFLINLTAEERKTLFKMGSKSVDFVQDAAEIAKAFPTILPGSFDKTEYFKDADLVKTLIAIQVKMDSLQEKIDDTLVAVGSEAMAASLEVYSLVQVQSERVPGLKTSAERLKGRFKKRKSGDNVTEVKLTEK